jgi:hypothetical protein
MFFARRRSEIVNGIELRGRSEFLLRTKESLALLGCASRIGFIQDHISVIRQGHRSGMKAWAKKPIFVVGNRTWQHSALWYAGAIAHDAYHSKLYHDAKRANGGKKPEAEVWTGAEAEKKCLAFQREVMTELNADPKTMAYLEECAGNPLYQGRTQGWQSWLDYLRRGW